MTNRLCQIRIGIGSWSFTFDVSLPVVPREGEAFGFDGDGPTTVVSGVSHTLAKTYLRCHERYPNEAIAKEDEAAWREAARRCGAVVYFLGDPK